MKTAKDNEPMSAERFDFLFKFALADDSTNAARLLECLGEIERLQLLIESEREACARIGEAFAETAATFLEKYPEDGHHMAQSAGRTIAATIRSRSGK